MQSIPGCPQRLLPGYNSAECSSRTQLLAVSPKEPKCLVGRDCTQTAQHSKQRSSPQQSHKPLPRHATTGYSFCPPGSRVVVDCCSIAQFAIPAIIILSACASTARQCWQGCWCLDHRDSYCLKKTVMEHRRPRGHMHVSRCSRQSEVTQTQHNMQRREPSAPVYEIATDVSSLYHVCNCVGPYPTHSSCEEGVIGGLNYLHKPRVFRKRGH